MSTDRDDDYLDVTTHADKGRRHFVRLPSLGTYCTTSAPLTFTATEIAGDWRTCRYCKREQKRPASGQWSRLRSNAVKTLVIAEPGCTHEGRKETLLRLLETAHACGADVWKPQWTSDPIAMRERRHIGVDHPKRAFYERAYSWLSFPVEWHLDFRDTCHALGMKYACTAFLPEDVHTLAPFVDYLKISSFEAEDQAMKAAAACCLRVPLILSTGGMDGKRVPLLSENSRLVLHCVSAYPAPLDAMNLDVLRVDCCDTRPRFSGLSDHSRHLLTGAVAVAAGAEVIEAHYRLHDCDPENPDYAVAFSPMEFAQYIQNIRDAETMLGDGIKRTQPCEAWAVPYRVTG